MAAIDDILGRIEKTVESADEWRVGLTNDPPRERTRRGSPSSWMQWDVDSPAAAEAVLQCLAGMGMQTEPGADIGASCVFVFRKENAPKKKA